MTVAIVRPLNRRRIAPTTRRSTSSPTSRMHARLRERIEWHRQRIDAGGDAQMHGGAIRQLRQIIGDPLPTRRASTRSNLRTIEPE